MKNKFKVNWLAAFAWLSGSIFLIPALQGGIKQAFGMPDHLSWAGAGAITLLATIGAMIVATAKVTGPSSFFRAVLGGVMAIGGLALAISADSASLWNRMTLEHISPASIAKASVTTTAERLAHERDELSKLQTGFRAAVADMAKEAPPEDQIREVLATAGKFPAWRRLRSEVEVLSIEIASATESVKHLETKLEEAQVKAATAEGETYWIAAEEWGKWAILGFAAMFELLLVICGGMMVSEVPVYEVTTEGIRALPLPPTPPTPPPLPKTRRARKRLSIGRYGLPTITPRMRPGGVANIIPFPVASKQMELDLAS
jgi:hypothetical protein